LLDGSVFLGQEALDLQLLDAATTSYEYIAQRIMAGDRVLKLHKSDSKQYYRMSRGISPLDILPRIIRTNLISTLVPSSLIQLNDENNSFF
jgi:ClpP class serine protease